MIWPLVLVLVAVVFLGLAWFGSERLLVLPRPKERARPDACNIPYEDVSFTTSDGVLLRGWFFPLPGSPVIVYCPGRGSGLNAFDFRYAVLFHSGGYQVLMFDWRGMGASAGRSSMIYWERLDLQAAVVYVLARAPGARLGAMGTSLGAAVLFRAAGDIPALAAVAGECAFASFEDMVAGGACALYKLPAVLARLLAWPIARLAARRRGFRLSDADPVRFIQRISPRPVLVIHGRYDRHVPVQAGYALYLAARPPKTLWILDTGHTQGLDMCGDGYARRLLAFFDAWLKAKPC